MYNRKGRLDVVKYLIEEKEADLLLKNKGGKTPRDLATNDSIKNLLEKAEEKQLKKLNEEKNNLAQTSAIAKGVFAGCATALLGTAVAVALFATGTVAVELMTIVIAAAALTVGGVTYMLSEPSVEQVAGNERKA